MKLRRRYGMGQDAPTLATMEVLNQQLSDAATAFNSFPMDEFTALQQQYNSYTTASGNNAPADLAAKFQALSAQYAVALKALQNAQASYNAANAHLLSVAQTQQLAPATPGAAPGSQSLSPIAQTPVATAAAILQQSAATSDAAPQPDSIPTWMWVAGGLVVLYLFTGKR